MGWGQWKWGLQEVASSLTESSSFFCSKVGEERGASCRTMASGWREPKFHMCPEPPVHRGYKESCQIHSSRPSSSLQSRDLKKKVLLHDRRQSPRELGWHLKAKREAREEARRGGATVSCCLCQHTTPLWEAVTLSHPSGPQLQHRAPRKVQQSYRAGCYTSRCLLSTSHRAASWTRSEDKQLLPHPCSGVGGAAKELWCLWLSLRANRCLL